MLSRGKFIVLEGLDGSGKTTQLQLLHERMQQHCKQRKCFATREPSESFPGLLCRGISRRSIQVENETIAMLFAADRYEHVVGELLPQLEQGNHILCDRYYFSNFAYQMLSTDLESLLAYNKKAMDLLHPDVTIYVDVSPEECAARRSTSRTSEELYEKVDTAKKIYRNYMTAFDALQQSERVVTINGNRDAQTVADSIWNFLTEQVFDKDDLI